MSTRPLIVRPLSMPIALTMLAAAISVSGVDVAVAASCSARKVNVARRHTACRLRAEVAEEEAAKAAAAAICDERLAHRWQRAEAKGGSSCAGTGELADVAAFGTLCSGALAQMAASGAAAPQCTPPTPTTVTMPEPECVDVMVSTTTTTMYLPPHCTNRVADEDESDVDCGGSCFKCGTGAACGSSGDCVSRVCTEATCAAATCSDGWRNGEESGTDCGGRTCAPCPNGETCFVCADCESGNCDRVDFFGGCEP